MKKKFKFHLQVGFLGTPGKPIKLPSPLIGILSEFSSSWKVPNVGSRLWLLQGHSLSTIVYYTMKSAQLSNPSLKILLWTLLSVNNICRKHQFVQLYFILYHSNGEIMFKQKSSVVVSNLHRSMEQELCQAILYDYARQSAHPSYQHRMHCWI